MLKKTIFLGIFLLFATLSGIRGAEAKVYIDLSAPQSKKLPIAIQDFKILSPVQPESATTVKRLNEELMDALKTDLKFSGLFEIIDKKAYIEDPLKAGLTESGTDFKQWRAIGAYALIKGGFILEKDRLTVEVRFFDSVTEKQVIGKRYMGSPDNPRRVIHYFTDQLYEELTGRKGIFTTRLLFVSDKEGNKEVYMSDYDGRNAIKITRNRSINLSPQWSPDGKRIIYVSYKKGSPNLHMLDLRTGKDSAVSERPGINIGGRFSPDGGKVALTLSGDKSPELHILDLNSGEYRKLTDNFGIDVSPSWSPDGAKLAFVSDTSGNPHIFVLDLLTGNIKRLTFNGKYNSSPAWSPDGRLIAYSRSDNGVFNIWVMQPDGAGSAQLTFEGNNRSPSWSPDGRFIIYSSAARGNSSLYIMRSDGTGSMRLETGIGNEKSPVWSPFLQ
ncbi:MAG: Tol-Pal system beta propeller repeat protein TolB [Deltaproteobacteria bacterium]|nr:Tol-Pal system beta propeller repeat protein TolB [Deltaproteobacteria bacterium]